MYGPQTSAHVDIVTSNNATFNDAFQFDPPPWWLTTTGATAPPGATYPTWGLSGQNFRMDVKGWRGQTGPYVSFNSTGSTGVTGSQIQINDSVNRVIQFNVPEGVIQNALLPGKYLYDLIMYDQSSPPIRVQLMHGEFKVTDGITGG